MRLFGGYMSRWWSALIRPTSAGTAALAPEVGIGFDRFLLAMILLLYASYGASMGLYNGGSAAFISGIKFPCLYLIALTVTFVPFYVFNCLSGLRLKAGRALRVLLLAVSAHAVALASFAPIIYLFTLTTSARGYVLMISIHVALFAFAAIATAAEMAVLWRCLTAGGYLGTSGRRRVPARVLTFLGWGVLYGIVCMQLFWKLRPWVGVPGTPYAWFRTDDTPTIEALINLIRTLGGSG